MLLAAVLERAPDYAAARYDYAPCCIGAPQVPRRRAPRSSGCSAPIPATATTARSPPPRPSVWASTTRRIALYRALLDEMPAEVPRPRICISRAHALKTVGRLPGGDRGLPGRGRAPGPPSATPGGASPTSRPTASPTAELATMRAAEAAPATATDRPLPPLLRARQGAGGPRRLRESWRLLRARQRAQARREPLPARDHRDQHRESAERGLHARSSSRRAGWGARRPRADLRRRPAALGLDADRADPRLALRRSRAPRSSPTSSASCSSCRAATRTSTTRAIRQPWRT